VRIAIGSDHAGFRLKEHLKQHLADDGHEVVDVGTHSTESVDYPDFAAMVGAALAAGDVDRGVLCCGSGNGMAIAANKIHGVRAAVAHDVTSARLAREHNSANVCCFGARFIGEETAQDSLRAYLAAEFGGGRHERRVAKIAVLDDRSEPVDQFQQVEPREEIAR
jgi:ribose 5-phosphate isomerase B